MNSNAGMFDYWRDRYEIPDPRIRRNMQSNLTKGNYHRVIGDESLRQMNVTVCKISQI